MSYGESIKIARIKAGLTQQRLADMIGVDRSTICNYEKEKRVPSGKELINLANALNVSIDYLFNQDNNLKNLHNKENDMLEVLESFFTDNKVPKDEKEQTFKDIIRLYYEYVLSIQKNNK